VTGGTYPDGNISSEAIWTKSQGPYMVNQDIIVATNAKLTIEAGTEIIFLGSYSIGIKGRLNVDGKEDDPVIFKFQSNNEGEVRGKSRCINVKNEIEDSVNIEYAKFHDFHSAVYVEQSSGEVTILGSEFYNHYTAVTHQWPSEMKIDNCLFKNNNYSLHGGHIEIYGSTFQNNNYGLYDVEKTNVFDSIFTGNNISISGDDYEIKRCKITGNNIGIQSSRDGFLIFSNHIVNNNIGILLSGGETKVNYNNIYNNYEYNLKSLSYEDIDATNNWWGTTDNELIDESIFTYGIYDGNIMGDIIYEPYLQSEITDFTDKDDDGIPDSYDDKNDGGDSDNGGDSTPGFDGINLIFILIIIVILIRIKKSK
jgi:hypothetical protein